jgi:hypothetical protein
MMQRTAQFLQREPTIWGPIFLLCTMALAVKTAIPFDLLFVAALGLFLSARLQVRGCCYSLILLGLIGIVKHAFLTTDHLWQLGIEGSLGCAFFITALAFEQGSSWIESLQSQMQTRKAAMENLEEEFAKLLQTGQQLQISYQEKVATLQKEQDDLQGEYSSILILNEVLRKTTARHSQERESIASALYDLRRQTELLREEYEALENELRRLKDSDALVMQNSILMKELNQARYDREQTHLINETLARLHIRENLRAREANQEAAYLKEMLTATHKEVRRIAQPLEEELDASRKKIQTLQVEFDKSAQEANRAREQLLKLSEIQTERNFLRERLQSAQEEIALLQKQPPLEVEKIDPQLQEKLKFAEEKMVHLSQIEHLYLQLKKQFEEKNQVLHKARSDLFKVETEFERLKIEKASLELNPIPKEVTFELEYLSKEVQALEDENRELQDLISVLSASTSDAVKQKKK